ncbi:protein of unknown function [Singulisphaera sp. GP187]|uniref:DUF1963 domain-containing protein n=1 Tax=Singulisphaera sp. GP187 TaxID=1882752 RepID=UPI000928FC4B|nr:DUF1963 domain-containing protein [Singulisphaera sp. GP187]SIO65795.1 protein of unknown function [Singulisphaera sp. GP187]
MQRGRVETSAPILAMLDALSDLAELRNGSRGPEDAPPATRVTGDAANESGPMIRAAAGGLRDHFPTVYESTSVASRAAQEAEARYQGFSVETEPDGPETVDELFWLPGEPPERSVTKVAGLPYRPPGLPWPMTVNGKPFPFFAQFCFADSRELFDRRLPGDVLLVFARGPDAYHVDPYQRSLRIEWMPLGLSDLVGPGAVPATGWDLLPFFGVHLRTDDDRHFGEWCITKVGGWPDFVQDGLPGGFLGGRLLVQVAPPQRVPGRWDRWPGTPEVGLPGEELAFGDAGVLDLMLMSDGTFDWWFECS